MPESGRFDSQVASFFFLVFPDKGHDAKGVVAFFCFWA
jgi:hypothetical protein